MFSLDFKIKIDRILFGSLAYILDRMAFFLGRFLKINHTITKENVKNVIIAKYLGLGSIVRSQVIIEDIKTTFPNAKIYYLTSKKNKAIFDIIQNVDKVLTIDDTGIISMAFSFQFDCKSFENQSGCFYGFGSLFEIFDMRIDYVMREKPIRIF